MSYDRHHYESFLPGALGLSVECDGHTQLLLIASPLLVLAMYCDLNLIMLLLSVYSISNTKLP